MTTYTDPDGCVLDLRAFDDASGVLVSITTADDAHTLTCGPLAPSELLRMLAGTADEPTALASAASAAGRSRTRDRRRPRGKGRRVPLPCPAFVAAGVPGAVHVGDNPSRCATCNRFRQAVIREERRRLVDLTPLPTLHRLRCQAELAVYARTIVPTLDPAPDGPRS